MRQRPHRPPVPGGAGSGRRRAASSRASAPPKSPSRCSRSWLSCTPPSLHLLTTRCAVTASRSGGTLALRVVWSCRCRILLLSGLIRRLDLVQVRDFWHQLEVSTNG